VSRRNAQLEQLVDVRREHEAETAAQLGLAREKLQQQQARLEELLDWRDNYRRNTGGLSAGVAADLRAGDLQRWRAFLGSLDAVIEQQQAVMVRAEAELNRAIEAWRLASADSRAVSALLAQRRRDALRAEERNEQDQTDDLVGRRVADQRAD
jgi:flagellar export protein FliJ